MCPEQDSNLHASRKRTPAPTAARSSNARITQSPVRKIFLRFFSFCIILLSAFPGLGLNFNPLAYPTVYLSRLSFSMCRQAGCGNRTVTCKKRTASCRPYKTITNGTSFSNCHLICLPFSYPDNKLQQVLPHIRLKSTVQKQQPPMAYRY